MMSFSRHEESSRLGLVHLVRTPALVPPNQFLGRRTVCGLPVAEATTGPCSSTIRARVPPVPTSMPSMLTALLLTDVAEAAYCSRTLLSNVRLEDSRPAV
jgi:hypothetical protein